MAFMDTVRRLFPQMAGMIDTANAPKAMAPDLAPPTMMDPSVTAAGDTAQNTQGRGRLATIMTSGRGLDNQPYSVAKRTLLGS